MTLTDCLRHLLSLLETSRSPSAEELRRHLAPLAWDVSAAGPHLVTPVWAYGVGGAEDLFLEIEPHGDVPGVRIWNDARGWGACAEISVRRGTVRDVESVVGPTREMPRNGPMFAVAYADPILGGHRLPVTLHHQNGDVRFVMLRFDVASR